MKCGQMERRADLYYSGQYTENASFQKKSNAIMSNMSTAEMQYRIETCRVERHAVQSAVRCDNNV